MRFILAASVLTACHGETIVVGGLQEVASLKAIPNPNLDILFVVDNSGSMSDQQVALAANFPRMMDALGQLDSGLPDLHIGVITSDMGTKGSASPTPGPAIGQLGQGGCAASGDDGALRGAPQLTGTFISDLALSDGSRQRNYTGELRDVFASMALVGGAGCGFEQHLAAMRRSFENPVNAGFVRPGANLAVIVIADEDDCSVLDPALFSVGLELGPLQSFRCTRQGIQCDEDVASVGTKTNCAVRSDSTFIEDVEPFVEALLALKGDPRTVMVAGVVGDADPVAVDLVTINGETQLELMPSCQFSGPNGPETANPAVRLSAFLDAFPGRSQLTSICSSDLSSPLSNIGDSAKKLIGDPCLDSRLMIDASDEPGVQPACEVLDIRDSAPDAPALLPACAGAGGDCYEMIADPIACPASTDHLRIRFRRTSIISNDTWTSIRCQLRS